MHISCLASWRRLAQLLVVVMVLQGLQVHSLPLLQRTPVRGASAVVPPSAPAATQPLVSLTTEAQAQTPPPDFIPLPSPITLARTQSAFAVDTLAGNPLTITYTIFNSRDEEIGEPLLVTELLPGVTLVDATPTPDQPDPPDGRLAFVLPSIPPFGEVTATLTLAVPASPGPVDDGGRAFGNIRTRAVKASVAPTELRGPVGANASFLGCSVDTNTSCPDGDASPPDRYVLQKVGEIGCDPLDLYEFVRDEIGYEVYRGSLRGARGTLWSMAGNSVDQASLLIAMLRACGIPARYASGTIADADAQTLILSMFPPVTRAVGGLPPADLPGLEDVDINDLLLHASQFLPGADEISDPANDEELLDETREHFWVQFDDDGSGFVNLDPAFKDAMPGETFVSGMPPTFAEVNDAIRHKVRFQLAAEILPTGAGGQFIDIADALAMGMDPNIKQVGPFTVLETTVLDQTFPSVELVGEPVSIGHFVEQDPIFPTITYSPWMQVGDRAELIRGTDYQEMYGLIGHNVLSGLFLRMQTVDAQETTKDFGRELVDRFGFAIRRGEGGAIVLSPDIPDAPTLTEFDLFTIEVVSSREPTNRLEVERTRAEVLRDALGAASTAGEIAAVLAASRVALMAAARTLLAAFQVGSDVETPVLERAAAVRSFLATPSLLMAGSHITDTSPDEQRLSLSLDLRTTRTRVVPVPGAPMSASFTFRGMFGLTQAVLESSVMPELPHQSSAFAVFNAALDQDIAVVTLVPGDLEEVDSLELTPDAAARVRSALDEGLVVVIPQKRATLEGGEVSAWFQFDPTSGEITGVTEDGAHGLIGYVLTFTRFIVHVAYILAAKILSTVVASLPFILNFAKRLGGGFACAVTVCKGITSGCRPDEDGFQCLKRVGTCMGCFAFVGVLAKFDPPLNSWVQDPQGLTMPEHVASTSLGAQATFQNGETGVLSEELGAEYYRVDNQRVGTFGGLPSELLAVAGYPAAASGIATGVDPPTFGDRLNFDAAVELPVEGGAVSLEATEGSLIIGGGVAIDAPVNVGISGFVGRLIGSDSGSTDRVDLSGSVGRLLIVSLELQGGGVQVGGSFTIIPTIESNDDDVYVVTAEGPNGWKITMANDGTTVVEAAPGASSGSYEVRFHAQSETQPQLQAEARTFVTVDPSAVASIDVRVVADSLFSVPNENTLAHSAFRIEIQNLSTTSEIFDVTVLDLPVDEFTLAVDSVVVGPGDTGIVGVAVHPAAGHVSPGTPINFSVTAAGRTSGLTDTEVVSFPYPEVIGVRPLMDPASIATIPGATVAADLILDAAGNVGTPMTLTVDMPADFIVSGLPATATLMPGETLIFPLSITLPPDATAGMTVPIAVVADLCEGVPPESCGVPLPSERFAGLALLIGVPEVTCLLEAAFVADEEGLGALAAALQRAGDVLSRLASDPASPLKQSRARAAAEALERALVGNPATASLGPAVGAILPAIASGDFSQLQTALGTMCAAFADFETAVPLAIAHGFSMLVRPGTQAVRSGSQATYFVRLENLGDTASTLDLSLGALPPGVVGDVNTPSVVLAPGEVIDGASPTPITVDLTPNLTSTTTVPFELTATVQEAPSVTETVRGGLTVLTTLIDILAVETDPSLAQAGELVDVSVKVANKADVTEVLSATFGVFDSSQTLLFTSSPAPISLVTGTPVSTFPLGTIDTSSMPNGTLTVVVTVRDAGNMVVPGGEGIGVFALGLEFEAFADVEPSLLPPGDGIVTTTVTAHVQRPPTTCAVAPPPAGPVAVGLTAAYGDLFSPIAVAWNPVLETIIVSLLGPPAGQARLQSIDPRTGTRSAFAPAFVGADEVKIVSAPDAGGFTLGDLFLGNGQPGQIARIAADGTVIANPWVTLSTTGVFRGGFAFDETGTFGNDLIAVANSGKIFRVNAAGTATLVADLFPGPLEGVKVAPQSFGPVGGQIIVGAGNRVLAVSPSGTTTVVADIVNVESLNFVPCSGTFSQTARLQFGGTEGLMLTAGASQFATLTGHLIVGTEAQGNLWDVAFDPQSSSYVATQIASGLPVGEDAAFLPMRTPFALPTLTDLTLFSANSDGSFGVVPLQWWVTSSFGQGAKLGVAPGLQTSPAALINAAVPGAALADIAIPLEMGVHRFTLFGSTTLSKPAFGLNIFANGATLPAITVFNENGTFGSADPFSVQPAGTPTRGRATGGGDVGAAGTASFTTPDGITVQLTDFTVSSNLGADVVSVTAFAADSSGDVVATMELETTGNLQVLHRIPRGTGVAIVPGSFVPVASEVTTDPIEDTISWESVLIPEQPEKAFSVDLEVMDLGPGEVRVVSNGTTVELARDSGPLTIELPPLTVTSEKIMGLEPEVAMVAPGETPGFAVTLVNLRAVAETFHLAVLGLSPALVSLETPVTLAAGETRELALGIHVPPVTPAGALDFIVTADGSEGSADAVSGQVDVAGNPVVAGARGVHVALIPVSPTAGQGTSARYDVVVTNTGDRTQTFDLSTAVPAGITATFQNTSLTVPPGLTAGRRTTLRLRAAQGTPAGVRGFSVTATAADNRAVSSTAQGTVTVSDLGVAVDLTPATASVLPDEEPVFTLTVTNTGTTTETFDLAPAGPLADFATLPASVTLDPGMFEVMDVTLTDLEIFLQQRTFLIVEARSTTDPLVSANDVAIVDFGVYRDVRAELDPADLTLPSVQPVEYLLRITNAGNAGDERYTMTFSSTPPGLPIVPATTVFLVPPLKTAGIPVTVTPPGFGTFTIQADIASDGQPLVANADPNDPSAPLPQVETSAQATLVIAAGQGCGNGTLDDGEDCDDGNNAAGDCCSAICRFEFAGRVCADDGNPCTLDQCDGAGVCTHDDAGNEGAVCRASTDVCDPAETCDGTSTTCPADAFLPDEDPCEDGDPCTRDQACASGVCSGGTETVCPTCEACDGEGGCFTAPEFFCRVPTKPLKAFLKLKDKDPDKKDLLLWKGLKLEATAPEDFGDPLATDSYTLCIYDESGSTPTVVFGATAPPGGVCGTRKPKPCWKGLGKNPVGSRGYRRKDSARAADGIDLVLLKPGEDGKAKVIVKGKGENLPLPTLPLNLPLRVQLQGSQGECWEATFDTEGLKKNRDDQFTGKGD